MDTGKTLIRQLKYCAAAAETEEEKAQVMWWQQRILELRDHQPTAEPQDLSLAAARRDPVVTTVQGE